MRWLLLRVLVDSMLVEGATSDGECSGSNWNTKTCCPAGKHRRACVGCTKVACEDCKPGNYQAVGSSASSCIQCSEGGYQRATGSTSCHLCGVGKLGIVPSRGQKWKAGSTSRENCRTCPHGYHLQEGAASCIVKADFFDSNTKSCVLGKYRSDGTFHLRAFYCYPYPASYYQPYRLAESSR